VKPDCRAVVGLRGVRRIAVVVALAAFASGAPGRNGPPLDEGGAGAAGQPALNEAARQYLAMLEAFAGFAEQHWNETEESYDAAGKGVTWARGNGGVCLVNAVLFTELPQKATFSPRQIPRAALLDHTRRTLHKLCLTSAVCTDPRALKPSTWGGPDPKSKGWHWQAGLETEHWVLAAKLLEAHLDDDTKALVRQVAAAEADGAAAREIRSARKGDTAADDCAWNAGILGVCAAIYADDARATKWDELAKRWALNMDGREPDRTSDRRIDGKPLREWLVATNVFPDFTLENHGFWDLPYQLGFAALAEPVIAYQLCKKPIPEAFRAHAVEIGESILKWLVLPDGDLLCPQGIDWAERDVQHSWGFSILGTLLDQPWALAAESRCRKLLTARQAAFGDGSIHALDFGYETDLAVVWTFSYLLHRHFGKRDSGPTFEEPRGAKLYPHVAAAIYRTPDMVSSVTWFRNRQGILVSPNDLEALQGREAFTSYDRRSGTGWIVLGNDRRPRDFQIVGEPVHRHGASGLTVSFRRELSGHVRQDVGYAALPTGEVVVFSRWTALRDLEVVELVDHPFRWVEVAGFIARPEASETAPGAWTIGGKLQVHVLGGPGGEVISEGVNGAVRRKFTAKEGQTMLDTVCVYQPITARRHVTAAQLESGTLRLGAWTIVRADDGTLSVAGGRS
jgi:hypothetical protein